jgi:hypothetical protein
VVLAAFPRAHRPEAVPDPTTAIRGCCKSVAKRYPLQSAESRSALPSGVVTLGPPLPIPL